MFFTTITPRLGDADFLGHVNNTVPALWFELGRNPICRIFDPGLSLELKNWPLIMAHTDYDFVAQVFVRSDVEIRTGISRIGNKSFTVYHEAWQDGKRCVTGHAVIVYYDFLNKQSVPIPEDVRARLAEHLTGEPKD